MKLGRGDEDVARYGQGFKDRAVARLLPPESAEVQTVSREIGVGADTLERWRSEALASGVKSGGWTAVARFEAVLATAGLSEAQKNAWCREQGIFPSELTQWREAATASLARPAEARSPQAATDRRRIRELERELRRKDRALAETAALLVLTKNSRRSTARARTHDPSGRSPSQSPTHCRSAGLGCRAGCGLRRRRDRCPHVATLESGGWPGLRGSAAGGGSTDAGACVDGRRTRCRPAGGP